MRVRIAVLLVMLLLAACGRGTGPTADGRSPDPQDTRTPETARTDLRGTLGGDPQLEGGCAWLDTDAGGRVEPRWPDGYRVEFDPVRLVGPDDDVIAEEGDTVSVRGRVVEDMMTVCQVGPVLEIEEVVGVGGA